jgi:hypothetical protein
MAGNLERQSSCPADRGCAPAVAASPLGTLGLVALLGGGLLGAYSYASKGRRDLGPPALGVAALGGLLYLLNRPAESECVPCPFEEGAAQAELERVAVLVRSKCEAVAASTEVTVSFAPATGQARTVDVGSGSSCIAKAFLEARVPPYAPPERSKTITLLGARVG